MAGFNMATEQYELPSITDAIQNPSVNYEIQGSSRDVPLVFINNPETPTSFVTTILNNILSMKVSYSISAATAVTFEVVDPGFELTKNNYFQVGQTLVYRSHNTNALVTGSRPLLGVEAYVGYLIEIADVEISQGQGNSPIVRVQCYTKAIQQMKRDRNPGAVKGSGAQFVRNAAKKYGLGCIAQETSQSQNITQASGEDVADSLWDVISRLASESKDEKKNPFIVFEADGILYFGSQQWLMYKWGLDEYTQSVWNKKLKKWEQRKRKVTYLHYPPRLDSSGNVDKRFVLNQLPTMHKSENDPMEGDGSCIVDRINGVRLRPGMTVNVGNVPWFTDDFLITSVDYDEMSPDPVAVRFATPPRQEKQIKQISVGEVYPGSVEWAKVFGIISRQENSFNMGARGTRRGSG
jgi:hypothetical protein